MMPVSDQQPPDGGSAAGLVNSRNDAAELLLDEGGMIRDCNDASEKLFGYPRSEVLRRHVSMLLPQLEDVDLLQNGLINPRLCFLSRIGGYFQALSRSGERFASDLFLMNLNNLGSPDLRMIVRREQHG